MTPNRISSVSGIYAKKSGFPQAINSLIFWGIGDHDLIAKTVDKMIIGADVEIMEKENNP